MYHICVGHNKTVHKGLSHSLHLIPVASIKQGNKMKLVVEFPLLFIDSMR